MAGAALLAAAEAQNTARATVCKIYQEIEGLVFVQTLYDPPLNSRYLRGPETLTRERPGQAPSGYG